MANRRDTLVKWSVYSAVCLFLLFLHSLTFANITVHGIFPFLPPILLATITSLEDTLDAVKFALVLGAACDLTLAAPFSCLYTIAFPLAAFLSSMLAKSVLQRGPLCALALSAVVFVTLDIPIAAALLFSGHASAVVIFSRAACEILCSLPLLIFCFPVFSFLHRFFTV